MSKSFIVKVYTPKGLTLEKNSDFLGLPGKSGDIGITENHTPSLLECVDGEMLIRTAQNDHGYFISSAIVNIEKDGISVITDYIEAIENIDKKRAQQAKDRAEKRLAEYKDSPVTDETFDEQRAKRALLRAEHRLEIIAKHLTH